MLNFSVVLTEANPCLPNFAIPSSGKFDPDV
jgi:hypothetical protein